ncbi:MAG: hypothetical protein CFE34_18330 [Rhodobacteraceae bacterium PARR1]|nr:MAG: hypothetical protein CFE34_18330 [Rhodobacteraceae bacterium PARR1]
MDTAAPVQVLTFDLTPQDVAAWIGTRRAERRAARALVASALLAGAMGLQVMSGRLPIPAGRGFAWAEAALILILPVMLALWTRRRGHLAEAARSLPRPVATRVEVWSDRIVVTEGPTAKPQVVKPRLLHRLTVTRQHILGETDAGRLILPRSAFGDAAAMQAFADRLRMQRG